MDLARLKKDHDEYIARLKADGTQLLVYRVPCCNGELESRAAPTGAKWDTLATCPHCGTLYMKITTSWEVRALTVDFDEKEE